MYNIDALRSLRLEVATGAGRALSPVKLHWCNP